MDITQIKNRIDLLDLVKNKIYIVSYNPLCYTKTGVNAYKNNNLKPFVDASCRREPDLENPYPSITAICRKNIFAPHLRNGDFVVYITNKGTYLNDEQPNNKLVAILQVIKTCSSHQQAANWYNENKITIPSNCFIEGTAPFEFCKTGGLFKSSKTPQYEYYESEYLKITDVAKKELYEQRTLRRWDAYYKSIVKDYPHFVITEKIVDRLDEPVTVSVDDFKIHFGKKSNTRRPFLLNNKSQLNDLIQLALL